MLFAANHCPYVRHLEAAVGELAAAFADKGVQFVAICSNDASAYPDDALAGLAEQADRAGWQFPYLIDEDQFVAKQFGAVCTRTSSPTTSTAGSGTAAPSTLPRPRTAKPSPAPTCARRWSSWSPPLPYRNRSAVDGLFHQVARVA